MPGRIGYHSSEFNWHLSQWIYSQFNRSNSTGRISNSTGHEILLKMGIYLNGFTPNSTRHEILLKMGIYLNGFTPNSTGQISNLTGHEILLKMG